MAKFMKIKGVVSSTDLELLIALYQCNRGFWEIKRMLGIANPSEYIARLELVGFAERNPGAEVGTSEIYRITEAGRKFLNDLKEEIKVIK